MPTKKLTGARVEYWKNKKSEWNYRLVGKNGKTLYATNQGWKRKKGMLNNIDAVAAFFVDQPNKFKVYEVAR